MSKIKTVCSNEYCGKKFWSKSVKGVPMEMFCKRCRNLISMAEERDKHKRPNRGFNRKQRRTVMFNKKAREKLVEKGYGEQVKEIVECEG